jgi:hypothetical protein
MKKILFIPLLAILAASAAFAQTGEWKPLFPNDEIEGWLAQGPNPVVVEKGVLQFERHETQPHFLVSGADYSDFELRFLYQGEPFQFGSVLFRTHPVLQGPSYFGYACDLHATMGGTALASIPGMGNLLTTHGPTLLPQDRQLLSPFKGSREKVESAKAGDFHEVTIRCLDHTLEVEINGVQVNSFEDDQYTSGKIALAVFPGLPGTISFSDLKIRELEKEGYESIFNGEDFSGWKIHGDEEQWRVEEGVILSESNAKEYSYLATEEEYKNFSIIAEFQGLAGGNSGLFFHSHLDGTKISGIQAEVQPPTADRLGHSGCLYDSSGRGWLIDPESLAPEKEAVFRLDEWNTIRVDVKDHRIQTWINGLQVVDYQDENPKHDSGVIALQLHSGQLVKVNWRNIRIKELD